MESRRFYEEMTDSPPVVQQVITQSGATVSGQKSQTTTQVIKQVTPPPCMQHIQKTNKSGQRF